MARVSGYNAKAVRRNNVQDILWSDNETPASPDETSGSQGAILSERETVCRTGEITDTGKDENPLSAQKIVRGDAWLE